MNTNKEKNSVYLSLGVIILIVIAIATFVFAGGGYLFYAIAIVAIIIGFYMSYYISKPEKQIRKTKSKK
ncbi:MAG: hypothetical protein ACP5RT_00270 [Candidatus Micrarchaeia archaeon]